MTTLRLSKHHGLGNDFLVLLDQRGRRATWPSACATAAPASAPTVCCSGTAGGPDDADLTMVLFNADGSRAEMSGNGIRCLAQAVGPAPQRRRRPTCGSPPTPACARSQVEADRRPGRRHRPRRHGQGPARARPRRSSVLDGRRAGRPPSTWATPTSCSSSTTCARSTSTPTGRHRGAASTGGINVEWIAPADRRATALDLPGLGAGRRPHPGLRHRRLRGRPRRAHAGAWWASGSRWPWRAARCEVALGDTDHADRPGHPRRRRRGRVSRRTA